MAIAQSPAASYHVVLTPTISYPKEDYGIKHAFPGMKPRQIEKLSQAWRPYRSYAVMSLWQSPHE